MKALPPPLEGRGVGIILKPEFYSRNYTPRVTGIFKI